MKPEGWNHKGGFLERSISHIFNRIGFDTKINTILNHFEIDVLAEREGLKIICECKLYEKSYLNLTSLIHEWSSKGKRLGVDRVLIAVAGTGIQQKHRDIAREEGVSLWDEDYIHKLNDIESKEDLYEEVGKNLEFKDVMEKYREQQEKTWKRLNKEERERKKRRERKREKERVERKREKEREKRKREREREKERKKDINHLIIWVIFVSLIILIVVVGFEKLEWGDDDKILTNEDADWVREEIFKKYDLSMVDPNHSIINEDNEEVDNFCKSKCGDRKIYDKSYHGVTSSITCYCQGLGSRTYDYETKKQIKDIHEVRARWIALELLQGNSIKGMYY